MKRYLIRKKVANSHFYLRPNIRGTGVQWTTDISEASFFFAYEDAQAMADTSIYAASCEVVDITIPDIRSAKL